MDSIINILAVYFNTFLWWDGLSIHIDFHLIWHFFIYCNYAAKCMYSKYPLILATSVLFVSYLQYIVFFQ